MAGSAPFTSSSVRKPLRRPSSRSRSRPRSSRRGNGAPRPRFPHPEPGLRTGERPESRRDGRCCDDAKGCCQGTRWGTSGDLLGGSSASARLRSDARDRRRVPAPCATRVHAGLWRAAARRRSRLPSGRAAARRRSARSRSLRKRSSVCVWSTRARSSSSGSASVERDAAQRRRRTPRRAACRALRRPRALGVAQLRERGQQPVPGRDAGAARRSPRDRPRARAPDGRSHWRASCAAQRASLDLFGRERRARRRRGVSLSRSTLGARPRRWTPSRRTSARTSSSRDADRERELPRVGAALDRIGDQREQRRHRATASDFSQGVACGVRGRAPDHDLECGHRGIDDRAQRLGPFAREQAVGIVLRRQRAPRARAGPRAAAIASAALHRALAGVVAVEEQHDFARAALELRARARASARCRRWRAPRPMPARASAMRSK